AVRAESGTHGRRRRRLAGLQLDLDERGEFLPGRHASPFRSDVPRLRLPRLRATHRLERRPARWSHFSPALRTGTSVRLFQILETWLNDSSTGVSRPKIETRTLSFWASALISLTVAGSVANGPSITVTDSPTSKSTVAAVFAVSL